ncbi:MAG: peptidoglycan DD-metalloendopeptidase family protein [Myxococcaceae bacterium]
MSAALVAALFLAAFDTASEAGGTAAPPDSPSGPPIQTILNRRIEPNQTMTNALLAAGLSSAQSDALITALEKVFDARKSRDGDQFRIVISEGEVRWFDYRQGPMDEWQVQRVKDEYVAVKRTVDVEKKVSVVELFVQSSLYEAALAAGEDPLIALVLSDVFAWDIDFYRDVRKGDVARAVVEKYVSKGRILRYGDVLAASYAGLTVGKKRVFRYEPPEGQPSFFQADGSSARKTFLKSPLKFAHVTSGFGSRYHPVLQYVKDHNGVDYGTPVGTPVWAVADGSVTKAAFDGAAGNHVCIRHANSLETCYLHLSRFGAGVRTGSRVSQKQVIAYSGNTGRSTGPHLHFALKRGGRYVNPLNQNFPRADPLAKDQVPAFREAIVPLEAQLDASASP